MIDEDLYQQAADELNSDSRRQHIWARACALASDDHDEARYLYTNLRVEELIAERDAAPSQGPATVVEHDRTLALEPTDDDTVFSAVADTSESDELEIPASVSAPSGIDRSGADDELLQLAPTDSDEQGEDESPDRISFKEQFDKGLEQNSNETLLPGAEFALPDNKFDGTLGSLPTLNRLADRGAKSDNIANTLAKELARSGADGIDFDDIQNDLRSELGAQFDSELSSDEENEPDNSNLSTTLDDTVNELDSTAVLDFDGDELVEFDTLAEGNASANDVVQQNNEQLDELLSGVSPTLQNSSDSLDNSSRLDHPLADLGNEPEAVLTGDFSDASGTQELIMKDDLEWLSGTGNNDSDSYHQSLTPAEQRESNVLASFDHATRMKQELERQADELPGQRSDIVAHEQNPEIKLESNSQRIRDDLDSDLDLDASSKLDSDLDMDLSSNLNADLDMDLSSRSTIHESALTDVADTTTPDNDSSTVHDVTEPENLAAAAMSAGATAGATAGASATTGAAASAGVAATAAAAAIVSGNAAQQSHTQDNDLEDFPDLPVDVSDTQSGTRYAVYLFGNKAQAVKTGVSWSALLFTLPFLIYRHMFGTAIVYTLLALIVLSGLLVTGIAWLDAGETATTLIKASTAGFAFLSVVGLLYLPFRHGNTWRANKLERRGYELVAWVRAKNPGMAISEARRAAALD